MTESTELARFRALILLVGRSGATLTENTERQPSLPQIIESLLFVSDGPLEVRRLQQVLEVENDSLDQAISTLVDEYRSRGLRLLRHRDALQLVTAPESAPYVEKLLGVQQSSKLSPAALETLAIIAYEQPVTRARVEAVRGVNCDRAMATLLTRGLVCEVGRLDSVGRPVLFGTTTDFMHYFGLETLQQMPPLNKEGETVDEKVG